MSQTSDTILFRRLVALFLIAAGCGKDNPITPTDNPPTLSELSVTAPLIEAGSTAQVTLAATDDDALRMAIIDYGDNTKNDTLMLSGASVRTTFSHVYGSVGSFIINGTVLDNAGQAATKSTAQQVVAKVVPQILVSQVNGLEGAVSRVWTGGMASDAKGRALALSFTPLSSDLVAQAVADTLRVSLSDANASGTRQLRVRVDYMDNGVPASVTKDVPVIIVPRDDISGQVVDYYLNAFLATVYPLVVMKGPYSGYVDLITGTDSVRAFLDQYGNFKAPKVANLPHVLKAFMTNGSDSSYVATLNLSPGDQSVTPKVFTNAGTDGEGHLPLDLLLNSLYKVVNFNLTFANTQGILYGMDLKNHGSEFTIYLAAKDTVLPYLPRTDGTMSYGWTPAQQDFLADYIQNNILKFIPPVNRPKIVKGLPTDALPVHTASPFGVPLSVTNDKYIVLMGTHDGGGYVKPWDNDHDAVFESAFVWIGFSQQNTTEPPWGIDSFAIGQEVTSAMVGDGSVFDNQLKGKTIFFEGSSPDYTLRGCDQKLLGLFEKEAPGLNNKIVSNFYSMPR
jgi:hypothetical protein